MALRLGLLCDFGNGRAGFIHFQLGELARATIRLFGRCLDRGRGFRSGLCDALFGALRDLIACLIPALAERVTITGGLGTVGAWGRIGRAVVPKVQGLGMQVVAFDPFADREVASRLGVTPMSSLNRCAR